MEEKPFKRLPQGLLTQKHVHGVNSVEESMIRDRADSHPLIELKYNSNELPIKLTEYKRIKGHHGKSTSSLSNSKNIV